MNEDSDTSEEEIIDHHKLTNPGDQLLAATVNGDTLFVKTLLDATPSLVTYKDSDGYTVLHRACYSGNAAILNLCLECVTHADKDVINSVTNDGWTPLHSASRWNQHNCVKILLHNDANVNMQSNGGNTPLHVAAECGDSLETLTLLLNEPDIDTTLKNARGETAHQIAQRCGKFAYLFVEKEKANQLSTIVAGK